MTTQSLPRLTNHATIIFGAAMAVAAAAMASGDAATAEAAAEAVKQPVGLYYAIAAIMGVGSLSAAYAVGKVGAAAMGAAAEKPELLGRAIAFVGLAEGIALFGFLISLFLVFK